MWAQSEKKVNFPFELLETLLRIMTGHENTMAYFASLPGLTYEWARYSDWIKPLLKGQTAVKCLSLFDIYSGYLKRIDETETPELDKKISDNSEGNN
jgi:hypothetical protein